MPDCSDCPDRGMCCRYLMLPLAMPVNEDTKKWVALHPGVSIVEYNGWPHVRIDTPCSALQPDGTCGLYGTGLRPRLCGKWPVEGSERPEGLEGCVYFEE